jgi:hypothetical protein
MLQLSWENGENFQPLPQLRQLCSALYKSNMNTLIPAGIQAQLLRNPLGHPEGKKSGFHSVLKGTFPKSPTGKFSISTSQM